jgi:hypothetical protein
MLFCHHVTWVNPCPPTSEYGTGEQLTAVQSEKKCLRYESGSIVTLSAEVERGKVEIK